jgi:hypothetical protein
MRARGRIFGLMAPFRKESLTDVEFTALNEAGESPSSRSMVPTELQYRLIAMGYVRQALCGLALTEAGKMRLAQGR